MKTSVQEVHVTQKTTRSTGRALRAVLLLGALAALVAMTTACTKPAATTTEPAATTPTQTAPAEATAAAPAPAAETVTELKIEDTKVGKGKTAKAGDLVTVHYTGWLMDGTKFDSSVDRGQPFQFTLGAGQVIPGWDEGVAGMKVGGTRVLIIPADKAYGPQGTPDGTIPPGATLKFKVELLDTAAAK
jgi:FKBP-type peptidyl-prolyl cis-trans isomerase